MQEVGTLKRCTRDVDVPYHRSGTKRVKSLSPASSQSDPTSNQARREEVEDSAIALPAIRVSWAGGGSREGEADGEEESADEQVGQEVDRQRKRG